MTIYIDLVLLENIIMNYIIILASAILSKNRISLIRAFISSIIGSLYAVLNYLMDLNIISNIIFKIVVSILMILIVFKYNRFKLLIKQLIMFYLVSFTFGGTAFMLLFFLKPSSVILNGNHFVGTYPIKITIMGGIVGFVIITIVSIFIKNKYFISICDIYIFYNNKEIKVKSLVDSGNLLKDPISKMDVIIVEKHSLLNLFDEELINSVDKMLKGCLLTDINNRKEQYNFRVIPFSSLGKENGMLIGFKPDYVKICGEEENYRADIIIGIYNGKLSKTNKYTSLVGLSVFEKGGRINENLRKSKIKYF